MTDVSAPSITPMRYFRYTADLLDAGVMERIDGQLQRFGIHMDTLAQQYRQRAESQTATPPSLQIYNQGQTPRTPSPNMAVEAATLTHAMEMLWDVHYEATHPGNAPRPRPHPSEMTGTDGDDEMHVYGNAKADTGAGNDTVYAYGNSTISMGAGNDRVVQYANSKVDLGEGDNTALMYGGGTATGGNGNDEFLLLQSGFAHGGGGSDRITLMTGGRAYGDAGDDHIELMGMHGTADGGDGDDTLIARAFLGGKLHGGAGDDTLTGGGIFRSILSGGTGNDRINLTEGGGQVVYNPGDGDDVITGDFGGGLCKIYRLAQVDGKNVAVPVGTSYMLGTKISLGAGISQEQVTIERMGDDVRIGFAGTSGSITLKDFRSGLPFLEFADGSRLNIAKFLGEMPDIPA